MFANNIVYSFCRPHRHTLTATCLDKHASPSTPSLAVRTEPTPTGNVVGQSVFYDCLDLSPMAEKHDTMKADRSTDTDEESECEPLCRHRAICLMSNPTPGSVSDIDQDCTIFAGVTYLGAATINAPKSEVEILRNMGELNASSTAGGASNSGGSVGMKVSVSIPICSEGLVV